MLAEIHRKLIEKEHHEWLQYAHYHIVENGLKVYHSHSGSFMIDQNRGKIIHDHRLQKRYSLNEVKNVEVKRPARDRTEKKLVPVDKSITYPSCSL